MIREHVGTGVVAPEEHFRWRGGEISRLEHFTDAVFAFAVTLIVVSLEVPKTFAELVEAMKGFVAFAVCFALLVHVWRIHYVYSRRYGLQTGYSVFLNSVLLFLVLFYVYPLKFLFTMTLGSWVQRGDQLGSAITLQQVPALMVVFSLGYAAVFAVVALLYRYAYSKRTELALTEYESLRTRHDMLTYIVVAGAGALVAIAAELLPVRLAFFSIFLALLGPGYRRGSRSTQRGRERVALERVQRVEGASARGTD